MRRHLWWVLILYLIAGPVHAAEPPRAVSLDYCADQLVLALADPEQIAGLSKGADNDYAYLRAQAEGYAQLRDFSEDVLALKPDVIIRSWGGDARAMAFYRRLGIPVAETGYADDFKGSRTSIRKIASALGQSARGEALIADLDRRLDAVAARADRLRKENGVPLRAYYVTTSGVTAGARTFVDAVMTAAGIENAAAADGALYWQPLPLEQLAATPPDFIVASFFDVGTTRADHWSVARHPVMKRLLSTVPTVEIPGAVMSCSAWYAVEAVERIHDAAAAVMAGRADT